MNVVEDNLVSWYVDRLNDDQIRQEMNDNNYDGSLDEFKLEVSMNRGSSVHCIEPSDTNRNVTGYGNTNPYVYTGMGDSYF